MFFIVIAILLILIICSVRLEDGFLDKGFTTPLIGALMILIVLHHILDVVGYPNHFTWFKFNGYLGCFFFISGYGNWISINKSDTISWLVKRLKRLYVIFIPAFIVMTLLLVGANYLGYTEYKINIPLFIKDFAIFSLPYTVNWFPKVFIITIIIFFIVCKLIKNDTYRLVVLTILSIAYIIICKYCFHMEGDSCWYTTQICFVLGCFVAKNRIRIENKLLDLTRLKRLLISAIGMIMIIVLFFAYFIPQLVNDWDLIQIVHALLCGLVIIPLSTLFKLKNKFLQVCGENSFEIYILHLVFWKVFEPLKTNSLLYGLVVYAGTALCVFVFILIKRRVQKKSN